MILRHIASIKYLSAPSVIQSLYKVKQLKYVAMWVGVWRALILLKKEFFYVLEYKHDNFQQKI